MLPSIVAGLRGISERIAACSPAFDLWDKSLVFLDLLVSIFRNTFLLPCAAFDNTHRVEIFIEPLI